MSEDIASLLFTGVARAASGSNTFAIDTFFSSVFSSISSVTTRRFYV